MKNLYGNPMEKNFVKQQRKEGKKIGEVVLGSEILYHHYFFQTRYIRYSDIHQIYLRIESSESGDFPIHEHSLVIVDSSMKEHKLHIEYAQYMDKISQWISIHYPNIIIGINKNRRNQQ
ncbi:MAG: hypothetical protein ACI4C1_02820 [Lachnospiraceae bacterium]